MRRGQGFIAPITVFSADEMAGFRTYFDTLLPQASSQALHLAQLGLSRHSMRAGGSYRK